MPRIQECTTEISSSVGYRDSDASARTQLAEDPLPGLNEEVYLVSNGTETCGSNSVADTLQ